MQPDVHRGGVVGVAGVVQLLGELLARSKAESRPSAFIRSTIEVRQSSFSPVRPAAALSTIAATSTVCAAGVAGAADGADAGDAAAGRVAVAAAVVSAVLAWAPWPKIAPMMLPKILMFSRSVRPRHRWPHGWFR